MTARDVDLLQHRIDTATRAATRIRQHLHDLHALAHENARRNTEPDHGAFDSRPPPGWRPTDDRAKTLWTRTQTEISRCEDILVGLERAVTAHFYAYAPSPEPSRGSLISAAEHDAQLARQRTRTTNGEYTPARLGDQPQHPGKNNR
jgi:hypothetical protein